MRIAGESSTQDVAITRFLLAILITVMYRYAADGTEELLSMPEYEESAEVAEELAKERWEGYWDKKTFKESPVNTYLEQWRDRFYLVHETHPFYQAPESFWYAGETPATKRSPAKPLYRGTQYETAETLVGSLKASSQESTSKHFYVETGEEVKRLKLDVAARWLIHAMNYCFNIKKQGTAEEKKTLQRVGIGHLGKFGVVMYEGKNLFETLMVNATLLDIHGALFGPPSPAWERKQVRCIQAHDIPQPDNLPELYTMQSRLFRLSVKDDLVCGYNVMNGEFTDTTNLLVEPMALWRIDSKKEHERKDYLMQRQDFSRAMWRNFPQLLQEGKGESGLVKWMRFLEKNGLIGKDGSGFFTLKTTAMGYDKMSYVYVDNYTDSITMAMDLMEEAGSTQRGWVLESVKAIEEISTKHIGNLAREITAVIYGEGTKNTTQVGTRMRSEYFALMDSPFRTWAASLKKDSKRDTYEAWTNTMCNIAMTVANNEINRQETQMFQYKPGKKGKHTMLNALNLYTAMVAKYRLKEGDDTANGK